MSIMAGMRCLNATCIRVGNAKIMATLDGNDFDKFVLKLSLLRYFVLACNSSCAWGVVKRVVVSVRSRLSARVMFQS